MSRHDDLDLRYLKALMQINKHLSHELNGYLQVLGVQLTLIGEIVHRTQPDDSAAWEKLRVYSTKALKAFENLTGTTRRHLATTSPPERSEASLDLRHVIQSVEALLVPYFKDEQKELQVRLPDQSVMLDGARDVIQRALLVVLVPASLAVNKNERLELRLDVDGILEVEGPPAHQWLPAVADIIEDIGSGSETSATGSIVAFRIPIQTRTR